MLLKNINWQSLTDNDATIFFENNVLDIMNYYSQYYTLVESINIDSDNEDKQNLAIGMTIAYLVNGQNKDCIDSKINLNTKLITKLEQCDFINQLWTCILLQDTITGLVDQGLLTKSKDDKGNFVYQITDLGRNVIENES